MVAGRRKEPSVRAGPEKLQETVQGRREKQKAPRALLWEQM